MSMPELTVDAGITVDLASKEDIQRHHDWLKKRLGVRRADYRVLTDSVAAAQLSTTNTVLLANFGSPPAGHIYAAQWLSIFPDSPFGAAIANVTAAFGVGPVQGGRSNIHFSLADIILPSISVPSFTNIPDAVLAVGGQQLYVLISGSGVTGGTVTGYNANLGVLIGDDSEETRAWI